MATTSVNGLITGLNTDQIIQGLLAIDTARIGLLKSRQSTFTQEQAAFQTVQAKLADLQSKEVQLGRSINGVFDARTATPSDPMLVTAAATARATPGVYSLRVNSLARAHEVASQGFASADGPITKGTFTIHAGTAPAATMTIDNTNDTLQGLADAINAAGAGVTATVVNDGSAGDPYRLLLAAQNSGTANAIVIGNNLAADAAGAARPVFDQTYIGPAAVGPGYTGTSTPTANAGAGGYTGTSNTTYTFTVVNGGTVGTDGGIQVAYADATGAKTGTLTLAASDAGTLKAVAQGIQVSFNAGTLVAGETFTVDATVPTVQAAANASVTLGSGPGALTVQSATNQLDGVIPGVTLSLTGADPTRDVTVTVAADTDKAGQAIQDFVQSYNDLQDFINQQTSYNVTTQQAGLLLGDGSATSIQDAVRSAISNVVAGINPRLSMLSELGITPNSDGKLDVDQGRLKDVLSGAVSGITLDDVRRLFALTGVSANGGVQFVTGGARTLASSGSPYQVHVTQAARQGAVTATNALADSTVIDGTNNTFSVTVDGKLSDPLTLPAGTYTRAGLAAAVQAAIDGSASLTGRSVTAGLSGNNLVITSASYGRSSGVAIGTGTALAALGFTGTESGSGQDVVGNFVVGGVAEPADGIGQFLTGRQGNAHTAGLEVRVTLTPDQAQASPDTDLTVTRGVAAQLDTVLNGLLDPVTGRLKLINDDFQRDVDDLNAAIDRQTQLMQQRQAALQAQFAALETTVSQLKTIGNLLTAQFTSVTALGSSTPTLSGSGSSNPA